MRLSTSRYSDLMRRPHQGKAWPTYWYNPANGELLVPGSQASVYIQPGDDGVTPLLDYLALPAVEVDHYNAVVYLACGETADLAPPEEWYTSAALAGWTVDYRGGSPKNRVAVCRQGSTRIDVRHTAVWFPGNPHVRQMRSAYDMLLKRLVRDFGRDGDSVVLKGTAAQTGLMLLDISLPRDKHDKPYRYAVPSDEALEILDKVAFQHRRELFLDTRDEIPGLSVYDARLSYAAYLRDLPMGEPVHDRRDVYLPYRPGWYRVTIDAPADWRHIGLAMDITHRDWPREGRFDTWISEPELRLLRKTPGWTAQIHERLVWPTRSPGDDPLRAWGDRLIAAYIDAEALADPELRRLLKGAVRHILLDTIGSFHRASAIATVTVPFGAPVDPATIAARGLYGYICKIPLAISRDRMRYYQPQIAGHIWARNRAALAAYVLGGFALEDVLGINTDAVTIARYAGYHQHPPVAIGGYRLKGTIDGPLPAPLTWADLGEMSRHAETVYQAFYGELFERRGESNGDSGEGAAHG